jgi:hypothetical protein
MLTKSTILAVVIGAPALMFAACSSTTTPNNDGGHAGTGGSAANGGSGGSAVPALGAQIDRLGRPAINTAITDPFDADATAHGTKQDTYNAATPATGSTFEAQFEANLATLDGLDQTCGNQFAADTTKTDATRYKKLADVLVDDQLYVDTSSGTCTTYLGVEANATNIIANADCGGRTLSEDVVDESYSLLAAGALMGVTDGVSADDKASAETPTTFPFLAPPS